MGNFLLYNSDGEITMWGQVTDGQENNQLDINEGEFILLELHEENSYIDMATIEMKIKSEMPSIINKESVIADDVDEIIISNLINETHAIVYEFIDNKYVPMDTYTVTDGSFEISFDEEGTYKIMLQAVPFLDKEYIVTAIEA